MTNYEEEKLKRLEKFESVVSGVLETVDVAISWTWAIIIIGITLFLYFKPVQQDGTYQASFFLFCTLFLLICSVIWKAIGKSKGASRY